MKVRKVYRCKFCKVEVVGPYNYHAVLGKLHKRSCPRRKIY